MGKKTNTQKALTPQQELFCHEYLIDLNATAAAKRAKYSAKSASELGYQLLQIPSVREKIDQLKKERLEQLTVDAGDVLSELIAIAKTDIADLYDDENNLLPIKKLPAHLRRAIAAIKSREEYSGLGNNRVYDGTTKEVKLWDKPKALELIGRHLKMFTDKIDISGRVTLEKLVAGSMDDEPPAEPKKKKGKEAA